MAIIVDPDNLDREQVIFGAEAKKLALRDVGLEISSALDRRTAGDARTGTLEFTDTGGEFQLHGVVAGQILAIFSEVDAGHYVIESVNSETSLSATSDAPDVTAFSGSGNVTYSIHSASGGTIVDGVTEQAVYSFAKEEWRVDSEMIDGDDLIRHEFPFEAITREQMEIGGGISHGLWTWFNEFTRKKVRTGGWADKDAGAQTTEEWTGIITLGSLDSDTQVYYQPLSATADPVDFTFLGAVNEPILISKSAGSDFNTTAFLKLFARKKKRTYVGSQISDIGVTTIETIVNRFPLAHANDPAITANDAEILGSSPFRQTNTLATDTAGHKNAGDNHITSSNFAFSGTRAGDTVQITGGGSELNFYTIGSVLNPATASIANDVEFTGSFATTVAGTLEFSVLTTDIVRSQSKAADIEDIDGATGFVTASDAPFDTHGVVAGDLLHILEDDSVYAGVYTILSKSTQDRVVVSTFDRSFPAATSGSLDYKVTEPGMYLQFKRDVVNTSSAGTITFTAGTRTLTRSAGNWGADGFTTGTVIDSKGTTSNNIRYTVLSVNSGDVLQMVATDVFVDETVTADTAVIFGINAFSRSIDGTAYGFNWLARGNGSTLSNIYQFVQHQLRQTTDIDHGVSASRGDVTDLLMSFATPTATTFDMYIDNLDAADTNNVTYTDKTGALRTEKFVAAGTITFNTNLQTDASAIYAMFFTNDDTGNDAGADYGTPDAILVVDDTNIPISGSVSAQPSVAFTFDYDNNVQRGAGSAATDAPVSVVAIGLETAQFVLLQGTITRAKTNTFALVSTLERNYSNP